MRTKLLIGSALALGLVLALANWPETEVEPTSEVTTTSPELVPETSVRAESAPWITGTARRYAVSFEHVGSATLVRGATVRGESGGQAAVAKGSLKLGATLTLTTLSHSTLGTELMAEMTAVDTLKWNALDHDLPPEETRAKIFAGQTTFVSLDSEGRIAELQFSREASRPYARVMSTLLRQALPTRGDVASEVSNTGLGAALTRWTRECADENCVIEAKRSGSDYETQSLVDGRQWTSVAGTGRGRFELANGVLLNVSASEQIQVLQGRVAVAAADLELTLKFLGSDVAKTRLDNGRLAFDSLPDLARQRALDGRIRGMTLEQIHNNLKQFGEGGVMPDHKRWLWQVTGWMRRHPNRTGEIGALFDDPTLGRAGQALVLDLLANVGHAQAQAEIRRIFDAEAFAARSDAPALLQRAVLLGAPETATTETMERHYAEGQGTERGRSAAIALGAMASKSDDGGRIAATLSTDYEAAQTTGDRRALLRALGNTRSADVELPLTAALTDPNPTVRSEAARALRRIDTRSAARALADMTAREKHPTTQKLALQALAYRPDPPQALDALNRLVSQKTLSAQNAGDALILLKRLEPELGADGIWQTAQALRQAKVGDRIARNQINSWVEELRARL